MRSSRARFFAAVLLASALGCGTQPVHGRYYQGLMWIEFRADGTVRHGDTGDTLRFQVDAKDKQKLVVIGTGAQTAGRIINEATVEFPKGDTSIALAFEGRWVALETPAPASAEDVARDAAAIAGQWRIPGETDALEFRADRSYQWGPRISGTYTMLGGQRVRMTFVQDGKPIGQMDHRFVVEGDELRLTAPDGAVTKYERVK